MKKGFIVLLITLLLVSLLFYILKLNKDAERQLLTRQDKVTQESIKIDKLDLVLSGKEIKSEIPLSFGTAKKCDELTSLCPECQMHWDLLVEEIKLIGQEAAGAGLYSMMPVENLQSLAEQGDPNGMFHHGANLVWDGAYGFSVFRHSSNYRVPNQQEIRSHKLNMGMVEKGESYLFQAAAKGKHQGWTELQNSKSMAFRKLLKSGTSNNKVMRDLIAQQLAITNVVKRIYKDDTFILELYFVGLTSNINSILNDRQQSEEAKEIVRELATEKVLIENLSKNYEQQYFNQWQEARAYLGKDIYPKQFPENFDTFYSKAMKLCLPNY